MGPEQKYRTSAGFRAALEERLNRSAKETGQDLMRLRRQVAFDRLLSRLLAGRTEALILKGGYALELRLNSARATKDIDLSLRGNFGELGANKGAPEPHAIQDRLQQFTAVDQGDYFEFVIGKAVLDLENAPYGGYRFPVEARMAGRLFIRFEMDVAVGDTWMEPHDKLLLHNWLDFAGIPATKVPAISVEQQFAEKLHAYTLPRKTPNSRVKDLVDLVLLIESTKMNTELLRNAVIETFKKRQKHAIPSILEGPPDSWKIPFRRMISECGLPVEIGEAMETVRKFCRVHSLIAD